MLVDAGGGGVGWGRMGGHKERLRGEQKWVVSLAVRREGGGGREAENVRKTGLETSNWR